MAFLADNLAAHERGGFKELFSFSHTFCHSCMTTVSFSHEHFHWSDFELRTPNDHNRQCSEVERCDGISVSTQYGINRCVALEDLLGFSVVDICHMTLSMI